MPEKQEGSAVKKRGAGDYEMLWDCRFCGTKQLLGVTHRHCPNCGAAQDPAWRYFPAEKDMVPIEKMPYVGVDKICPACKQPNSSNSTYCSECGADLATGQVVQTQGSRELGMGIAETDTRRDVVKDKFDAEMKRIGADKPPRKPIFMGLTKTNLIVIGVVALVALIIGGIIYAVTYRKAETGTVEELSWHRVVEIQVYGPHNASGWDESVPGGAYSKDCERRQRDTKKVESGSHEECRDVDQGNGSFKRECHQVTDYRDEPVYDQWCEYTVNTWTHARNVESSGDADQTPADPKFTLAAAGANGFGQERTGDQREVYVVEFRDSDNKKRTCEYEDQDEWAKYQVGMAVSVKVKINGSPDCDTLKPAS